MSSRSPARVVAAASLADAVDEALASRLVHFAPPGHKRSADMPSARLLANDITLLAGVDDQRLSRQLLPAAEAAAAEAWGADWARLSVQGATHANQALCLALGRPGQSVVIVRACHKSIPAGLVLSGLRPVWVMPEFDHRSGLPGGVRADEVAEAVDASSDVCAVLLTEPSYFGAGSDVAAIAKAAHDRGVPLAVDQAWAAHFGFHPDLPDNALRCGADVAVTSLHKTLPAFSQSAIVMARDTGRIDLARLAAAFDALTTTSPSAAIYASIDRARALMQAHGARLLGNALDLAAYASARLTEIPGVALLDLVERGTATAWRDPLKLVIDLTETGQSGLAIEQILRTRSVQVAYADEHHLVVLLTIADRREDVDHLSTALTHAASTGITSSKQRDGHAIPSLLPEAVMTPRDAYFGMHEAVSANHAVGRIAAETIALYPPGMPALLPGERIGAALLDQLRSDVAKGRRVIGAADASLETLRVVSRQAPSQSREETRDDVELTDR